jgi:hypothetical protein
VVEVWNVNAIVLRGRVNKAAWPINVATVDVKIEKKFRYHDKRSWQ